MQFCLLHKKKKTIKNPLLKKLKQLTLNQLKYLYVRRK